MEFTTQELNDAAAWVHLWAKRNEAVVRLANILEKIGSFQQAVEEAQGAKEATELLRAGVKAELDALRAAATTQAQANADAIQAAHNEAAGIVAKADEYAKAVRSGAESQAAEAKAAAWQEIAGRRNQAEVALANINADSLAAHGRLQAAEAAVEAAKSELAGIESKLKAAQEARRAALA